MLGTGAPVLPPMEAAAGHIVWGWRMVGCSTLGQAQLLLAGWHAPATPERAAPAAPLPLLLLLRCCRCPCCRCRCCRRCCSTLLLDAAPYAQLCLRRRCTACEAACSGQGRAAAVGGSEGWCSSFGDVLVVSASWQLHVLGAFVVQPTRAILVNECAAPVAAACALRLGTVALVNSDAVCLGAVLEVPWCTGGHACWVCGK
jgi:hypothetical protein